LRVEVDLLELHQFEDLGGAGDLTLDQGSSFGRDGQRCTTLWSDHTREGRGEGAAEQQRPSHVDVDAVQVVPLCYNVTMVENAHRDEVGPQGRTSTAWGPVARRSTHELVIDAIEEQIMSGALAVGDLHRNHVHVAGTLLLCR